MKSAIVMGGSIAGLCAAGALAKGYERVIILERDEGPAGHRRGTPQAHHIHLLLSQGRECMDAIFPTLFEGLAKDGAVVGDAVAGFPAYIHGIWTPRWRGGLQGWQQTRPLLEHHLRRCAKELGNVEYRTGARIDTPICKGRRIVGVRFEDGSELEADLVVDATGRGSRSVRWLMEWGFGQVPIQKVHINLAYVSGLFEPPPDADIEVGIAIFSEPPHNKRNGLVGRIEGGRVVISLSGYHHDHPPTDHAGFLAFAKTLVRPELYDILVRSKPLSDLRQFKFPFMARRRYGELPVFPANYLVLGDAVCNLDPTFGQGMTVSARQAILLAEWTAATRDPAVPTVDTPALQKRIEATTDNAWDMVAIEASRWPETRGWKPIGASLRRRMTSRLFHVAEDDVNVYEALISVIHLEKGPGSLLRPRVIRRMLFG